MPSRSRSISIRSRSSRLALGLAVPSRVSAWARATALPVEPDPHQRQELLGIDRLRNVIRRAGFDALFPIAFHRLRSQRDDRKLRKFLLLPDLANRLVAVEL